MEKENKGTYIEIDKDLVKSIKDYCKLNNLTLTVYINSLLKKAFMVEKYGEAPPFLNKAKEVKTIVTPTPVEDTKVENIPEQAPMIEETIEKLKPKTVKKIKTY